MPDYAWTDLTYLLHSYHVQLALLRLQGHAARLRRQPDVLQAGPQSANTPGIWNPLPWFDTVKQDGQLGNIAPFDDFLPRRAAGTLPAVSWIVPSQAVSEHPPALVSERPGATSRA